MSDQAQFSTTVDVGEYCRRVEDHLTKINAGHLVRIFGTGFDLVRGWAEAGVPLSVVFRGIEMKAERHREGQAKRPLRIEFCEPDVLAAFNNWRRSVGFQGGHGGDGGHGAEGTEASTKRPSLTKHLDRAIDRLSRAGGRLDWPAGLRDECDRVLQALVELRAASAHARGAARDEVAERLPALDADLGSALRVHAPAPLRASLESEAAAELAAYRARLNPAEWQRSVDVTTDRLLRDRLGLPVIDLWNEILDLTIERPVAGGRMLARHDGRVVFVSGAIPGERVRARVERANRQAWWASTTEVVEASPDRRDPPHDPACGGSAFAHIRYDRQRELKQQILVDAFRRLARVALEAPPAVAASPEQGYRLRARLHCAQNRVGYYLEGTHTMCDAAATAQLLPEATRSAQALLDALGAQAAMIDAITVSENVDASERVLHVEPRGGADAAALAGAVRPLTPRLPDVTGVTMVVGRTLQTLNGRAAVVDSAPALFGDNAPVAETTRWVRRAPAFFQANRYLIGALVRRVLELSAGDRVIDFYAGVGLFSVALAARGAQVVAVEGEPFAVEDLRSNAVPWQENLEVVAAAVEEIVRRPPPFSISAAVLDPPRTGLSDAAQAGLAAWRVPTLVYVSCDPATLARDAAKFLAAGYQLASLDAFDLFPNTPHVEAVALFTRGASHAD